MVVGVPPFQVCSQGLGKQFALDYAEQIKENGFLYFYGVKVGIPRYYCKILDYTPPEHNIKQDLHTIKYFRRVLRLTDEEIKRLNLMHSLTEIVDFLDYHSGETKQREIDQKTKLQLFDKGDL